MSIWISYSLFSRAIDLRAYLSAERDLMVLLASWRPTPCSTCWSSSGMALVYLVRPRAPSIYVSTKMYDSLFLVRWYLCPNFCLKIFSVIVFLHFCYWFCLNSWDNTGASAKNILVSERFYSYTFVERFLVHQSCYELRRSFNQGGLFLQLIDESTNTCNLLYTT